MYSLNLGLTNRCNLNCSFCPTRQTKQPLVDMPKEMAFKIIDEVINKVQNHISLALFGESTLHNDINEIIDYIKNKRNIKIILYTNGVQLKQSTVDRLDKVIISLDATNKSEYIEYKGSTSYTKLIEKIKKLKGNIVVQYARLNYKGLVKGHNQKVKHGRLVSWGGKIKIKTKKRRRLACGHIFEYLNIASNGDVIMCCFDYNHSFDIGNIKDGVMKIWNGKVMNKLRKDHRNKRLPRMCLNCENEYYYNT